MRSRGQLSWLVIVLLVMPAAAQVGARTTAGPTSPAGPAVAQPAPVMVADASPVLAQIQSTAQATANDLSQMNIRKWKAGGDVKSDAEAKADSIRRNLTAALPGMVAQVQSSPNDFPANFKLYRTLGVLYDVMSSLVESAGAFGPKGEFENLAADLNRLNQARRALGDRIETLASAKDAEIVQLRNRVSSATAAASAKPKKIIVDDDESPKKTTKKKTTKKKSSTETTNPPAQPNKTQ